MREAKAITDFASPSCDTSSGHIVVLTGGGGKLPLFLVDDWRSVTALFDEGASMSKASSVAIDMKVAERVSFHVANCRSFLPGVVDESADCIAATRLAALFDPGEEELLLAEIFRVLRPGGRFVALQRIKARGAAGGALASFAEMGKSLFWFGSRRKWDEAAIQSGEIDFYGKFRDVGFEIEKKEEKTGGELRIWVVATKPAIGASAGG